MVTHRDSDGWTCRLDKGNTKRDILTDKGEKRIRIVKVIDGQSG